FPERTMELRTPPHPAPAPERLAPGLPGQPAGPGGGSVVEGHDHLLDGAGSRGSGLDRAAPEEADACPERDDAHPGGGRDLLGAVEGLAVNVEVVAGRADGHGDGG